MEHTHRKDIALGLILLAISIGYFIVSLEIQIFSGTSATIINARTVPYLLFFFLTLLSVILLIRGTRGYLQAKAQGNITPVQVGPSIKDWVKNNYTILFTFCLFILYAACFETVGYIICTVIFTVLETMVLTNKGTYTKKLLVKSIVIAIVFTLLTKFLFVDILYVPLPAGLLR